MQFTSFASALDAKLAAALWDQENEDNGCSSPRGLKRARTSIQVSVGTMVVGIVLSALAVQGYKSYLPYTLLVFSAAAIWRLMSTVCSSRSEHARRA